VGGRILKLDPLVSSQIAAGEVVQRPASIVKELAENSLDAGAQRVTIDFEGNGLSLVRVSDDGSGMPAEDVSLAVERFATSKLYAAEDLSRIATLGFRGEALPSITSCSRLTLETRLAGALSGVSICVEAGRVLWQNEKGLPPGTTVTVENLFFNTPARLKFVKSRGSERQAAADVVLRLALAWPDVSFTFRSGGNVALRTSGLGLRNALADVFGPSEAASMAPLDVAAGGARISGFVGLPSLYRRKRDRQMFSVNSRPVRNPVLGWALDEAFEGLLPPKAYAVAALNIAIPPEDVDVNVHPTKAEVRFRSEREVRSSIAGSVRETLRKAGFDSFAAANGGGFPRGREITGNWPGAGGPGRYAGGAGRGLSRAEDTSGEVNWDLIREPALVPGAGSQGDSGTLPPGWEYMGPILDTYLVALTPSALLVIDKHSLMESLTFQALLAGESGTQDLLMAEVIHLDPKEALLYEDSEAALEAIGFGSRLVGDRTVMVTRVPLVLGRPVEPGALKEVLARLKSEDAPGDGRNRKDAAREGRMLELARMETAACHASVRARELLSREEAQALLRDLYLHPEARTCPHGRPAVREYPLSDLDHFFGRTSHAPVRRV
jgi:DNA mismatch repair protein MutL